MGFLSKLWRRRNSEPQHPEPVFPKEEFFILEAKMDGKPVIGSFNAGYATYRGKKHYPWCLKIGIALVPENLYENGLPPMEESTIANELKKELLTEVKKMTTAHYIGHLFNDTFLDFYVYLAQPQQVREYLQMQINKEGLVRGFGYTINKDSKWRGVEEFLSLS